MFSENYGKAERLVDRYASLITGNDHRRSLLLKRVSLLSREGHYDKALDVFYAFKAIESKKQVNPAVYDIIKQNLISCGATPKVADGSRAGETSPSNDGAETTTESPSEVFSLQSSYPNPFNPTATIPFELATQAKVTITAYDLAGRQVMTLTIRPMMQDNMRCAL